ncbi:hypothetical protein SCA6_003628 [Theobroma cacao]
MALVELQPVHQTLWQEHLYKGASVMKTLIGNTATPSKVCPFPRVNVAVKRRSSVPVRTVVIHGLAPWCVDLLKPSFPAETDHEHPSFNR